MFDHEAPTSDLVYEPGRGWNLNAAPKPAINPYFPGPYPIITIHPNPPEPEFWHPAWNRLDDDQKAVVDKAAKEFALLMGRDDWKSVRRMFCDVIETSRLN